MYYNSLTTEEERVIVHKGTEAPGTGEYEHNTRDGVYVCRRCNSPLYDSTDKFSSRCGWPSFDDEILGAITRTADADGRRVEITCAVCGGHLGHVFEGEGFTNKNTRHCVNSLSMRFIPRDFSDEEAPYAVFGGGCFWCLDATFRNIKGVTEVVSGYAGGYTPNPSYEQVCAGETGHAEVVRVSYNPREITYADLLEVFFALHDPTTPNRQGNDVGEQYRSIIFYVTWQQKLQADEHIQALEKHKVFGAPIVTQIVPLITFAPAEEYHQNYYAKNPQAKYCQAVITPKLTKLRKKISRFFKTM